MHVNWQKKTLIVLDLALGGYLVAAFTAFNKPDETARVCTKTSINIQDEATNGFINAQEIKARLERSRLYPLAKPVRCQCTRHRRNAERESVCENRRVL